MKNRRKWKFKKVCLLTLILGGIGLLLVPPFTLEKYEQKNEKIVEELKKEAVKKKKRTQNSKKEKKITQSEHLLEDEILGYLAISKIDIEYAIKEGANRAVLAESIGHLPETAGIGEKGNCVLAGHRGGRKGVFFLHLDRLCEGDSVELMDRRGNSYSYVVTESFVTDSFDNSVKEQGKRQELTLLTCTEHGTKRLIVKCKKKIEEKK